MPGFPLWILSVRTELLTSTIQEQRVQPWQSTSNAGCGDTGFGTRWPSTLMRKARGNMSAGRHSTSIFEKFPQLTRISGDKLQTCDLFCSQQPNCSNLVVPIWDVWRCFFLAEVRVQEGEPLENALRRFKRKVQQEDIIKEVKRHSFYLKPGEKRRVKEALARKRNRKKARKEAD